MTDLRKAAEMALEALEKGTTGLAIRAIPALRQALAQDKQRENRMTDREAIQKALDTPHRRYSIEPHGNGYAIYRDRDLFHHGFNLGHLTEVTPETIELIENALNTTLAYPEQEPVAWMYVNKDGECEQIEYGEAFGDPSVTPLYTAPPKREWVGLTYDEAYELFVDYDIYSIGLLKATEAKLKEKNNG